MPDVSSDSRESSTLGVETVAFAQALLRIRSVNTGDPDTTGDAETRAARWVEQKLVEVGYDTVFVEPTPGRGSIVTRLAGTDRGAGALVVHAHLDVVPVTEEDWTHPPFAGEIHDEVLFGRGAVDMKGQAAAILAVARELRRSGASPRRDLIFAFLADEEAGGTWGAGWLVENRPELLVGATEALGEVGGFSLPLPGGRRAYLAAVAEKGASAVTLTARGTAGHASLPRDDNPVVRIGRAIERVASHRFPVSPSRLVSDLEAVFAAAETAEDPAAAIGRRFVAPLLAGGRRSTVTPTVLRAGGKVNVVPGEASAVFDVRIIPGEQELVRATVAELAGDGVEVVWRNGNAGLESPADASLIDVFRNAIGAEDPQGIVVPYLLPASTDNKHFAKLGVNGYGFLPLQVPADFDVFGLFHAADERIPLESLRFCARVMARILTNA